MEVATTYTVGGRTFSTKEEAIAWADLQERQARAEKLLKTKAEASRNWGPSGHDKIDSGEIAGRMGKTPEVFARALAEITVGTDRLPAGLTKELAALLATEQQEAP